MEEILVLDSATRFGANAAGRVAVCGSHGGTYPAWLAARARVRAVVLSDAGVGREGAGVAGLAWLERIGIAACAVDCASARIGDGASLATDGRISHVNAPAAAVGCAPGMACSEAAERLKGASPYAGDVPAIREARAPLAASGHRDVWTLDSIALVEATDRRAIIVSGSHGALLGARANDGVLAVDVFAAFFNDAGGGKDGAGWSRLPALEARGIAGATVSANTARIGDGRSTYETGVLSRVNPIAERLGLREGMGTREAVARLLGLA